MERIVSRSANAGTLGHIMQTFAISMLVSFLGTLAGALFIPKPLTLLFMLAFVVMAIAAIVIRVRGKHIGYGFLYTFSGVSGVMMYPVIEGYGSQIGANLVSVAFFATSAIFGGLALYAHKSKRDFSFLGGFLVAATLGLVVVGIASMFISFGPATNLIWAIGGIIVFSGWTLYDIAQYKNGVSPEEVPMAAMNIYLDFLNLFLYVLKFIASIASSRD